jgi:hypothetical protein
MYIMYLRERKSIRWRSFKFNKKWLGLGGGWGKLKRDRVPSSLVTTNLKE